VGEEGEGRGGGVRGGGIGAGVARMVVVPAVHAECRERRDARGRWRAGTCARHTLPLVPCYHQPRFHPWPLSCIHYFLVDTDDDGDSGGDSDDDDCGERTG